MTRRDRATNLTSAEMRVRKDRRFLLVVGVVLVAMSVVLYAGNILVFHRNEDTFYYMWIDLAFIPLEVLIVGVIVERIISRREKGAIAQKLNMVIGAFFSELGTPLLAKLLPTMLGAAEIREHMHLKAAWKKSDFSGASHYARELKCEIDLSQVDLYELRGLPPREARLHLAAARESQPHRARPLHRPAVGRDARRRRARSPPGAHRAADPRRKSPGSSMSVARTTRCWRSGCSTWSISRRTTRTCSRWSFGPTPSKTTPPPR